MKRRTIAVVLAGAVMFGTAGSCGPAGTRCDQEGSHKYTSRHETYVCENGRWRKA